MNIYLLELIGKWICTFILWTISFIGIELKTDNTVAINENISKSIVEINNVVAYDTEYIYNTKVPYNIQNVIIPGEIGLTYTNREGNLISLRDTQTAVIEQGWGPYGSYQGKLTAYGPDCPGCSSTGTVSCKTVTNESFSIVNDGIYYTDSEYGEVRILAAARAVFPCGTIIKVKNNKMEEFYGIVMDTGGAMIKAWNEYGYILIDVAYKTEEEANNSHITSVNTSYSVQRWGW